MNKLQIFNNTQFGQIRTIYTNEPWFILSDLCKVLDLSNPTMVARSIEEDDLNSIEVIDELGRKQIVNAVNESGLYQVIFKSRKEEARKFQKWVTSEVLPSIRETGQYNGLSPELKSILILDKKTQAIEKKVDDLESSMPLFNTDCKELQQLVRKVATAALGGYKSIAYNDKSLRSRVYSDIQKQLRREFGVERYEAIKRCQLKKAKEIVTNYRLPLVIEDEIVLANQQISMLGA